jgi:disulfide bond formation protein DsbB
MMLPPLRIVLLLSAALAGAVLFSAFASEWWGGFVPCALCLLERWPYRFAICLGLVGAAFPPIGRVCAWLAVLVMLGGAGIGVVHVGVENKAWPSPLPECVARVPTGGTIAERLAQMPALPSKSCDDATYLIPGLPVSMAAMNALFCLAFAVALGWATVRARR